MNKLILKTNQMNKLIKKEVYEIFNYPQRIKRDKSAGS